MATQPYEIIDHEYDVVVVGAGGVDGARTLERVLADRGVAIRDILAVEVRGPDVFVYHNGRPAIP
mgnify:CR=1 FL=1